MKTLEELAAQMADKTNDQLLAMFQRPDDWQPMALDAARGELQRRGMEPNRIPIGPPPMPLGQPHFFPVSVPKFVVMSTITFGLYQVYWFYQNWELVRRRTGSDIKPFWRALFGVWFCHDFFKEVGDAVTSRGLPFSSSMHWLATGWILLTLCHRLPDPYWLVGLLSPLPLIPVQNAVNALNTDIAPNHDPNSRFSSWNTVGLVLGGICFVLAIFGAFPPSK